MQIDNHVEDEDYIELVGAAIKTRPIVFIYSNQERLLRGESPRYRYEDIENYLLENFSKIRRFSDKMYIIRELINRGNTRVLAKLDPDLCDVAYTNIAKRIMEFYPETEEYLDHDRFRRERSPSLTVTRGASLRNDEYRGSSVHARYTRDDLSDTPSIRDRSRSQHNYENQSPRSCITGDGRSQSPVSRHRRRWSQ